MNDVIDQISADEWMMFVALLIFIISLRIIAYWLTKHAKELMEMPPENACPLHDWTVKTVDPEDPSFGTYLVCSKCGKTPNGLREEKHHEE
jgi:hypothetical protein